jgi:glutathione S-transferase
MLILYGGGRRSPFVRRVAIWLTLQNRPFERRDVNIFGDDFSSFAAISPLSRVPALTLPSGETLIETAAIIDWLEDTATAETRLIPATGDARRQCMQGIACANAVADKGVALVYEVERRPEQFQWLDWRDRLATQLDHGLAALEARVPASGWIGGDRPSGADIAAVAAYDFVGTIKSFSPSSALPRLAALSALANAGETFSSTYPPRPA